MEGFKTVNANQTVEFEVIETEKGLRAVNITIVE
jgi:cold shock CspA family protein